MNYITVLSLIVECDDNNTRLSDCLKSGSEYETSYGIREVYEKYQGAIIIDNITEELHIMRRENLEKHCHYSTGTKVMNRNIVDGMLHFNFGYRENAMGDREEEVVNVTEIISTHDKHGTNGQVCVNVYMRDIAIRRRGSYYRMVTGLDDCNRAPYKGDLDLEKFYVTISENDFLEEESADASIDEEDVDVSWVEKIRVSLRLMGVDYLMITDFGTAILRNGANCEILTVPDGVTAFQIGKNEKYLADSNINVSNVILPSTCKKIYECRTFQGSRAIQELSLGGVEELTCDSIGNSCVHVLYNGDKVKKVACGAIYNAFGMIIDFPNVETIHEKAIHISMVGSTVNLGEQFIYMFGSNIESGHVSKVESE